MVKRLFRIFVSGVAVIGCVACAQPILGRQQQVGPKQATSPTQPAAAMSQYALLKSVTEQALSENHVIGNMMFFREHFYLEPGLGGGPGMFDLIPIRDEVGSMTWVGTSMDAPEQRAVQHIAQDLVLKSALAKLGLLEVVREDFDELDKLGARHLSDADQEPRYNARKRVLQDMVPKLNAAAASHQPPLPPFEAEDGCCGVPETITYEISIDPPGARVRIIPVFRYYLCQASGIDPNDPSKCFGWSDAQSTMVGLGWYNYRAIWPDGAVYDGRFNIIGAKSDAPIKVSIGRN